MGNKRGVQTQLALARLRGWRPDLVVWGMSATLGNLEDAKRTLLGPRRAARGVLVEGRLDKELVIDTLLPDTPERFPWGGHLGLKMAPAVVGEIEAASNNARLHQRALAGRALVSATSEAQARLGGRDRAPSRLARPRNPRLGRARPQAGFAESGRLHVEPRSWRRFPARRARVAGRIAEGRRAAPAARRAQRPRARPRVAHHHRAEPDARTRRGRRGQARHRRAKDRKPPKPVRAARRARAALRDRRARRRVSRRGVAGRGARNRRLRKLERRSPGPGASISSARADRASPPTRISNAPRPTKKACGAPPANSSASAIGSTSARSSPTRRSWCNTARRRADPSSARSRNPSSRACARAKNSGLRAARSNSSASARGRRS